MKLTAAAALLLACSVAASAQTAVTPPPLTAEQEQRLAALPPDTQVYERFRFWAGFQLPAVLVKWQAQYDDYLRQASRTPFSSRW